MPLPAAAVALPAAASALGALGNVLSGNQQREMSREQAAEQKRQFDIQSRQRAAETSLNATQMDPLAQQRSRQKMALIEQLMKGASSPTLNVGAGKFEGGMQYSPEMFAKIASFFTPEARAGAEQSFATNAATATGGQYAAPNLGTAGYGAAAQGGVTPTTGMPNPQGANQLPMSGPPERTPEQGGIFGALDHLKQRNKYQRQSNNPFDQQGF
jgi:hypothetical protein